ncbi:hypothetical protein NE237_003468 [Protea cynaroides]|uniref:Rab-GAP TBC domain-containing protein n=1 Tax=Protea cynaroides TaxID=273540 RepID=A0A9Q0KH34_9MAGN|nr:hypothetical protein NE237_003468 [Protea cynaroides]
MKRMKSMNHLITFEHKRDAYGFAVRPQHLQRYQEYANIYQEEEEERSERWKDFLVTQAESAQPSLNGISEGRGTLHEAYTAVENVEETAEDSVENVPENQEIPAEIQTKTHKVQIWMQIRPSLSTIEDMMGFHLKKKKNLQNDEQGVGRKNQLSSIEEARPSKGASEEDSEDEFYDVERSDIVQDTSSTDNVNSSGSGDVVSLEPFFPWKEELECLVRGGVPMALRGELWQAFVGVKVRRIDGYYQNLLATEINAQSQKNLLSSSNNNSKGSNPDRHANEKWKGQIEKDLPRTFPGHPALDEDGRDALRRLLTAYARHNPSVGYCQAMNFFAGLFLLLMPEENAFWTMVGIIDDYFDGYFSEEMIESQVDQLVLEDLVREKFPKLVNHLDYLGVQVAWVTGPWFLSIFVNMLPWESVLRVWDVLLFEGNRVMLFRTALALMELYGPALVTTKDAGDAVTLLQSLVVWLKVELCRLLEEKRSCILRAEELETALMEMVKQDNRRQLSARVEQLEQEVAELRQALADKQEQERAMLQVLMRVEQEQKVTEDARRFAEQDAAAQRYAVNILQEKYEAAMASFAQMEKRAVMAETMLEATLQYQSGQFKAQHSPRSVQQEPAQDIPTRKISLLSRPFGLGWRDRNKGKLSNAEEPSGGNSNVSVPSTVTLHDMNGEQE